jgi:hypothetical protein
MHRLKKAFHEILRADNDTPNLTQIRGFRQLARGPCPDSKR